MNGPARPGQGGREGPLSINRKHLRELIRKYGLDPRHKLDGEAEAEPSDD